MRTDPSGFRTLVDRERKGNLKEPLGVSYGGVKTTPTLIHTNTVSSVWILDLLPCCSSGLMRS